MPFSNRRLLTDAEEITITVNSEQTNQYSSPSVHGQGTVNKDPDKTDYNEGIVTLTAVLAAITLSSGGAET